MCDGMKIAVYIGKEGAEADPRVASLRDALVTGGCELYDVDEGSGLDASTDMVMSVGGDGTFLLASMLVRDSGIPVVGVNLGRLGFLSENRPENVAESLLSGEYVIEERALLRMDATGRTGNPMIDAWPYALNEFSLHRGGAAMLGVDVRVDGVQLPTYWADGLLVSTSSGSTAYSLSVGGPIVLPDARVLIISPIAPHNLNVRPLIVSDKSVIDLKVRSRDDRVVLTADNRNAFVSADMSMTVRVARFSLRRVRLNRSDFINALTEKLFWGEDIRNIE